MQCFTIIFTFQILLEEVHFDPSQLCSNPFHYLSIWTDILEARFGWWRVNGGCFWRVVGPAGRAATGSRCLSGLLAPHQDYPRREARGRHNRLRPDNLFIPYRKNIIREEVSCLSEPQTFSCWARRLSHTSACFIGKYIVLYVSDSSQARMTS